MLIFLLIMREYVQGHREVFLFAIFSAVIWLLWVVKVVVSRRYTPWKERHDVTTSVVIPVVDEPLDLFRDVLARITQQAPTEVIVVINGARNLGLEAACAEYDGVRWIWTPVAGKRNAVRVGTEMARGDIIVLVDSDTLWTSNTLENLVKPFADVSVGGVTTRQRIVDPERSFLTRWADWLENARSLYAMPTQSVLGQVGCLPGRTIAFRRHILMRVMDKFLSERFLGVFLEVSDDRTLTNYTLKEGYRTVYQHDSLVYTDAPLQVKKLFKQQLRWARGSQYNTLRMVPWMLGHAPLLLAFFLADIILPFLLIGAITVWVYKSATGTGINLYEGVIAEFGTALGVGSLVALTVVSSVLSMSIRQARHLAEKPSDFFRLPAFILFSTLFLMPVRVIGFFRMAHASGWGTRAGAYAGGDPGLSTAPHVLSSGSPEAEAPARAVELVTADRATALAGVGDKDGRGGLATQSAPELITSQQGEDRHVATAASAPAASASTRATTSAGPLGRRPLNPWAALPYLIGAALLTTEVTFAL